MLFVPLYRSPTQYAFWHGRHHTHLGTTHDSEQFKTDIDSTWRRIVYATVLGVLFPQRAFARRPDARPRVYPDTRHLSLVIYTNHGSWGDPLVGLVIKAGCFADRSLFVPIDAGDRVFFTSLRPLATPAMLAFIFLVGIPF